MLSEIKTRGNKLHFKLTGEKPKYLKETHKCFKLHIKNIFCLNIVTSETLMVGFILTLNATKAKETQY